MDKVNVTDVTTGDAEFGLNLMPYLGNGNVTFSPNSIRTAFSMLLEGAKGNSAKELVDVLKLQEDDLVRQASYTGLLKQMNKEVEGYKVRLANGLWIEQSWLMNEDFKSKLTDCYSAVADNVDFKTNAEDVIEEINGWVNEKTEEKIKELFPSGSLNADTVLALVNALYFKGEWDNKFDDELTQKQDFTLLNGETVQVDMMRKGEVEMKQDEYFLLPNFRYGNFDDVQAVRLPYKGEEMYKMVLLPPVDSDVVQLEGFLREQPDTLLEWMQRMYHRDFTRLEIPKHEVKGSYDLIPFLKDLGLSTIFQSGTAELSGIGSGPLFVSAVQHEAYFKSDEEGSEGAAATGIGATLECMPPPSVELVADRPYLELIVHEPSKSILFMNRIADPR